MVPCQSYCPTLYFSLFFFLLLLKSCFHFKLREEWLTIVWVGTLPDQLRLILFRETKHACFNVLSRKFLLVISISEYKEKKKKKKKEGVKFER